MTGEYGESSILLVGQEFFWGASMIDSDDEGYWRSAAAVSISSEAWPDRLGA